MLSDKLKFELNMGGGDSQSTSPVALTKTEMGGEQLLMSRIDYWFTFGLQWINIFTCKSDVLPQWTRWGLNMFGLICFVCLHASSCLHAFECVGSPFAPPPPKKRVCINQYCWSRSAGKAFSPHPGLGAVARSRRRRWWPVWTRRLRGDSFLQLELSPSGDTKCAANKPLDTQTLTTLTGCHVQLLPQPSLSQKPGVGCDCMWTR